MVPHSLFQETLVSSTKYMQRGDTFRLQNRNLQKKIDRLVVSKHEIEVEKAHIYADLSSVQSRLGEVEERLATMEDELKRSKESRRKAKERIPEVKSRVAAKVADTATVWNIKEKGIITDSTRAMARNLVSLGVPQIRVGDVVKCVLPWRSLLRN